VTAAEVAQHHNAWLAIFLGVGAAAIVGLANGLITAVLRINSLIATLAMSFVVGGLGSRITRIRVLTFVLSSTAAGLAVVIDASRVLSASASSADTGLAFTVLAGIVVGGTSILGGDGAVWRSVVGVLFIALIGNGYILLGLDPLYEQITMGLILLAAVALDAWTRRAG
jgi:ribose transport system permease protein